MRGNVFHGAGYVLRGAQLLTHPALRPFVVVPLLANVVIFAGLIYLSYGYISGLMEQLLGSVPAWLDFITWLIWPLVILAGGLITGYLFTALAILIASPFNSLLAEKAEELITGKPVDALEGLLAAFAEVPRAIVRELAKFIYYVPMALFVLVLTFIPVLNAFSPLLWFLLGAWMMSIQYVDYPMDNHKLRFGDVKEAVRQRRLSSIGFGGVVALCAGVPVLNFFIMPSAVVGATLLWCEELAGEFRRP